MHMNNYRSPPPVAAASVLKRASCRSTGWLLAATQRAAAQQLPLLATTVPVPVPVPLPQNGARPRARRQPSAPALFGTHGAGWLHKHQSVSLAVWVQPPGGTCRRRTATMTRRLLHVARDRHKDRDASGFNLFIACYMLPTTLTRRARLAAWPLERQPLRACCCRASQNRTRAPACRAVLGRAQDGLRVVVRGRTQWAGNRIFRFFPTAAVAHTHAARHTAAVAPPIF